MSDLMTLQWASASSQSSIPQNLMPLTVLQPPSRRGLRAGEASVSLSPQSTGEILTA